MKITTLAAIGLGVGAYRTGYLPTLLLCIVLAALLVILKKPGEITRRRINRLDDTLAELDLTRQRIEHGLNELRESGTATQAEIATHERRLDQHDRLVEKLEIRRARLEASLSPLRQTAASAGWPDALF